MPTFQFNTNRIMSVLKVETDINTNIEYVKTFKSDIIVFICYVIMYFSISVSLLILTLVKRKVPKLPMDLFIM